MAKSFMSVVSSILLSTLALAGCGQLNPEKDKPNEVQVSVDVRAVASLSPEKLKARVLKADDLSRAANSPRSAVLANGQLMTASEVEVAQAPVRCGLRSIDTSTPTIANGDTWAASSIIERLNGDKKFLNIDFAGSKLAIFCSRTDSGSVSVHDLKETFAGLLEIEAAE